MPISMRTESLRRQKIELEQKMIEIEKNASQSCSPSLILRKENYCFEFTYDNGHVAPLMGKALVLGTDAEGESVAVKSTLEEVESKIKWVGKVAIYHGQTGFEIVPIEADVEEAKNSIIREEVNKTLSKIFNKGGKNDS